VFERGYRRHLEADLVKWVSAGVISDDAAQAIRKVRFSDEATSRLPGIFAMLGALMLAASVSAFVAANWQEIPRLVRLAGILAIIAGCFFPALLLQRRGHPAAADATVTFATLCFGAGIALVGQMYHLPGDWPAGAMLVAIGALVAAGLTGKSGPLVVAFVAMASWSWGRAISPGPLAVPAAVRAGLAVGAGPRQSPARARCHSGAQRLAGGAADAAGLRQELPSPGGWRDRDLGRLYCDRSIGAGARMARHYPVTADVGDLDFRLAALR
jgi:hypothetical protein